MSNIKEAIINYQTRNFDWEKEDDWNEIVENENEHGIELLVEDFGTRSAIYVFVKVKEKQFIRAVSHDDYVYEEIKTFNTSQEFCDYLDSLDYKKTIETVTTVEEIENLKKNKVINL